MLLSTSALSSALPEVCAVLFAYLCVQFGRISKPKSRAAAATLSQKVEKKSKRSSSTADESAAGAEVEKPQSRKRVALKWLSFGLYHAAIAYLVLCAVPSLQRWLFPVFHDRVGSQTAPMATAATIFAVNAIAFHSLWLSGWHHRVNYELAISKYLPPGGVWKVFSLLLVYLFAPECCSIGLGSDNIIVEDLMSGEKLYATLHSFIATDSVTIAITVVLTLGTTAVLLLWHRWAKLDYSDLAIKNTRILNLCSVAFINGYVEEVVFRGLFLQKMFFTSTSAVPDLHQQQFFRLTELQQTCTQSFEKRRGNKLRRNFLPPTVHRLGRRKRPAGTGFRLSSLPRDPQWLCRGFPHVHLRLDNGGAGHVRRQYAATGFAPHRSGFCYFLRHRVGGHGHG